jgi:hypothetical protein
MLVHDDVEIKVCTTVGLCALLTDNEGNVGQGI